MRVLAAVNDRHDNLPRFARSEEGRERPMAHAHLKLVRQ